MGATDGRSPAPPACTDGAGRPDGMPIERAGGIAGALHSGTNSSSPALPAGTDTVRITTHETVSTPTKNPIAHRGGWEAVTGAVMVPPSFAAAPAQV